MEKPHGTKIWKQKEPCAVSRSKSDRLYCRRSSITYSDLNVEETADHSQISEPPIYVLRGSLKRTLIFFALISGTTFVYSPLTIGYYLSTEDSRNTIFKEMLLKNGKNIDLSFALRERDNNDDSSKPSWTWLCRKSPANNKCVRHLVTETSQLHSLKTCNMICSEIPVWPYPTGDQYYSETVVTVEPESLALNILKSPSHNVSEHLQEAFEFMKRDILKQVPRRHDKKILKTHVNKDVLGLDVRVKVEEDADPRLRLDTEENYNLQMKSDRNMLFVKITAKSFCGARHGFETFSQLIWYDHYTESVLALELASVGDAPKFRYRGLLLDTARQYFPVANILRTIDAMAASKMNTFHWHATDSQSFPLKLNSVPQLALYGAYSLRQVYTTDDITTIVHRARIRGIRVVIEVDAPAHIGRSWSWGNSSDLGDLAYCVEYDPWKGFCGEPPCGQLNPNNDHVYEIFEKIYKEIIELTGVDDVFHLGGDEVNSACWNKFMKSGYNVYEDSWFQNKRFLKTWYDFTQKITIALQNANKGKLPQMIMIWSSRLTSRFQYLRELKNYTIQFWFPSERPGVLQQLDTGIRTIISNLDNWYLDCGFGQWFKGGLTCQPYRRWQTLYNNRIWENYKWNMDGGTACMWTEQLAPEDIDARIWPRAAAVAERLWTDPSNEATAREYLRLDMQRQRLVERGVRADVIWSRWCSENPYECL